MTQPELPFSLPTLIRVGETEDDTIYQCPVCGGVDTIDGWDCWGADVDCLFCNECGSECRQP